MLDKNLHCWSPHKGIKTGIIISDDTLKQAKYCNKNFRCLSSEPSELCKVAFPKPPEVKFIECLEKSCPYRLSFENGAACSCPVRIEIHNKYGI